MRAAFWVAAGLALGAAACDQAVTPGEVGVPRALGEVLGEPPLDILPPVRDRDGNVYVLSGSLGDLEVFVGHPGGGWSNACQATEGRSPRKLWVGASQSRAWYWSGDTLVEVSGADGTCVEVLDREPRTGTDLQWKAVAPFVEEAPSRLRTVALVKGPTDDGPFVAVIDLQARAFGRVTPLGHGDVRVLGVGGSRARKEAVFLIDAGDGPSLVVADSNGTAGAPRRLAALGPGAAVSVVGSVAVDDRGLAAALLDDGRVLVIEGASELLLHEPGMTVAGVHVHEGKLFLVGTHDGQPVVSAIGAGGALGPATVWQSSLDLFGELAAGMRVLDDRDSTQVWLSWDTPRSAIGVFPFVSPFDPDADASGLTGWIVAGPGYLASGAPVTRVAFVPVGLAYP